jgi:hypothetical protein
MMKKMILTAAVAMLAVPAMASAQNTVTATATVAQYALVSGSGDLAFGTLSTASDNVIDAAGGAGHAARTLDYNHNVTVTFTSVPANLTSGTNTLPVALTCASRIGAGSWSAAAACGTASMNLDVGTAMTQATLGFGGTITAANAVNAVAGNYTGTFNIVVVAR